MAEAAKKILVADDDPGTLVFYKLCFEAAGFEVEAVEDTTTAVVKCLEFDPDIILLDADMPGGGGAKAAQQINELLVKGIPILFVSGYPEAIEIYAFRHNIKMLKKPASAALLVKTVNQLLAKAAEKRAYEEDGPR